VGEDSNSWSSQGKEFKVEALDFWKFFEAWEESVYNLRRITTVIGCSQEDMDR
jgi:hypothetical protein